MSGLKFCFIGMIANLSVVGGCAGAVSPTPAQAPSGDSSTSPTSVQNPTLRKRTAIDPNVIGVITGGKPEQTGKGAKVSFPRTDVAIEVDGWTMPPFMGLTSWATFTPGEKPRVEAMVMGDLVLFEDEVNPVMSALLDAGIEVTALHNHFFFDKPNVFFMHIGGEGSVETLAKGVKSALDEAKKVRFKAPRPASSFEGATLPLTSTIDAAKLDVVLGVKGTAKDGMYKATMGRKATAACGCTVGKAEGVNTWAAFAGTEDNAVVDGDFAVTENELQPVLRSLRASRINIVAIHHHMTGESPRILFLHYWGRGTTSNLAASVKKALDLTAWDRP